jgi:hypothetical protein
LTGQLRLVLLPIPLPFLMLLLPRLLSLVTVLLPDMPQHLLLRLCPWQLLPPGHKLPRSLSLHMLAHGTFPYHVGPYDK